MAYSDGSPFRLVGGRLALDFLNTADWSSGAAVVKERLESAADLQIWLKGLGLEAARPESMDELRAFRGVLRPVFIEKTVTEKAAATLNEALGRLGADLVRPGDLETAPLDGRAGLASVIALSAAAILSDEREFSRIKICPGTDCGWLFLDETKNQRRRWCSMETCGNRAKAKRIYYRRK